MVIALSPSKSMTIGRFPNADGTNPEFSVESDLLLASLKKLTTGELKTLMKLSDKLAMQTHLQFQQLKPGLKETEKSGHAALTYTGDVYAGLQAMQWNEEDTRFAQEHLRILSAMYGSLKPMDLIQPYRLEMGLSWKTPENGSLYLFWSKKVTEHIRKAIQKTKSLYFLQLASDEYARCIDPEGLGVPMHHVSFFEWKDGKKSFSSFHAKKARGLMASFVISNQLKQPEQLKNFDKEGYRFSKQESTETNYVFIRNGLPH